MSNDSVESRAALLRRLNQAIDYHRRWKIGTCTLYVVAILGTLGCSTAATVIASLGREMTTAILAGSTTVLVAIEKSLLFREKWKLHLAVQMKLEALRLRVETTSDGVEVEATNLGRILEEYSSQLPIEPRET
jgi:exosortase/archaeosortase